jgi:ubiquitin-protein ligase
LINRNVFTLLAKANPYKIDFHVNLLFEAVSTLGTSSERLNPSPTLYFERLYNVQITNDDINNFFLDLRNESSGEYFYKTLILNSLNIFKTDLELKHFIITSLIVRNKNLFLKFLYFFIFTVQVSFDRVSRSSSHTLWRIQNNIEKETEFSQLPGETELMYHGTLPTSLYSILRNGLISMSGTNLQSNGAAFGSGIYVSNSFWFASTYSDRLNFEDLSSKFKRDTNKYILVVKIKNKNKVSDMIYVQQSNEVLLIGIIQIKNSIFNMTNTEIFTNSAMFLYNSHSPLIVTPVREVTTILDTNLLTMTLSQNEPSCCLELFSRNRIKNELDRLMNVETRPNGIKRVNFYNPNDKTTPLLVELFPECDTLLYHDLLKYNLTGIKLAIYIGFSVDSYPFTPPKVRVISPKFINHTGSVTQGGAICSDLLYTTGWSPANNLISILTSLLTLISNDPGQLPGESRGRIDETKLGESYTWDEYNTSYDFISNIHGWVKPSK